MMKVYYYFILPVTNKYLSVHSDPSIDYIKINSKLSKVLESVDRDGKEEIKYYVLKGVEESSVCVDTKGLHSYMHDDEANVTTECILMSLLECFNFDRETFQKYLYLAHQPLLVINCTQGKMNAIRPKSLTDVFNHCFLHFNQYLHLRNMTSERKKIESLITLSDTDYTLGVDKCARYAFCCVNNIAIEATSKKLLILQHECIRDSNGKFDNNLYKAIYELFK